VPFAVLAPGGQSGNFWIHPRMHLYERCCHCRKYFWNSCCGIAFITIDTFFVVCLQYPEIFVPLRQTLFLRTVRTIRSQVRGTGWGFHFSNRFLGQKLLDRERPVSWSIVIMENLVVGAKFRDFSTRITLPLSKFNCIAIVLILKRLSESSTFRTFSNFHLFCEILDEF
jgi:hypothetical protein